MEKETQRKLITLPIKLEPRTYKAAYNVGRVLYALFIIACVCIFIAGLCWFIVN